MCWMCDARRRQNMFLTAEALLMPWFTGSHLPLHPDYQIISTQIPLSKSSTINSIFVPGLEQAVNQLNSSLNLMSKLPQTVI